MNLELVYSWRKIFINFYVGYIYYIFFGNKFQIGI